MDWVLQRTMDFFLCNLPPVKMLVTGGPIALLWAYASLSLAGYLKTHRGFKTGYSRKVFHFLIFFSVALVQYCWGTRAVCLFGIATSLVIFYAVFRGDGHPLYEAMAREKDAPHRTLYILAPYCATFIGGVAANILFGQAALAGYLVTGLGDAVGEPIGTRFGRHSYRVPSLSRVRSTRTLEGSAAVLVACAIAIVFTMVLSPQLQWTPMSWLLVPLLAVVCALVEAVSPHGWDNATMQIVPSLVVAHLREDPHFWKKVSPDARMSFGRYERYAQRWRSSGLDAVLQMPLGIER